MGTDITPVSDVERAVATQQPPKKRALLTDAIKACLKIVRAQDKKHKQAFVYAKAMCDNERELGRQLAGNVKKGGDKRWDPKSEIPTLEKIGISKDRSHRAQRMAKVPDGAYDDYLDQCEVEDDNGRITIPTLDGVYNLYGNPPVSQNTGHDEWFTPQKYIDAAREVMGEINLDPASCKAANKIVGAKHFYTTEDNGLNHGWIGNIWLNPPFSNLLGFTEKLVTEYREEMAVQQAVMLGPNFSDSGWWQRCAEEASSVCHTNRRIRFVSAKDMKPTKKSPTNGHTFFYFGDKTDAFLEEFQKFGVIR